MEVEDGQERDRGHVEVDESDEKKKRNYVSKSTEPNRVGRSKGKLWK